MQSIELNLIRNHRHPLPQHPHHHQHHHHQQIVNSKRNTIRPQSLSQTIHEAPLQIRPAITKAPTNKNFELIPQQIVKKSITKSPTLIKIRLDNSRVVKLNITKLNANCRLCLAFMRYLNEQNCKIPHSIPIYI